MGVLISLLTSTFAWSLTVQDLHAGDAILYPLNCYICRLISVENGNPWSHSGLVMIDPTGERWIAESIDRVALRTPKEFLSRARVNGVEPLVVRPKESVSPAALWKAFANFEGLPFDSEYLWDNHAPDGREKLYCSEFITKLLNRVLVKKLAPHPMDFSKNLKAWESIFSGAVPQGEPGNAPGDFLNFYGFSVVGTL